MMPGGRNMLATAWKELYAKRSGRGGVRSARLWLEVVVRSWESAMGEETAIPNELVAVVNTTKGAIRLRLFPNEAPLAVLNKSGEALGCVDRQAILRALIQ